MDRYVMISSDCHAAPPMKDYRQFVDPNYRDAFDDWLTEMQERAAEARRKRIGGELFDKKFTKQAEKAEPVATGGLDGLWDHDRRVRELEADGVVGEIMFPNGVPFSGVGGPGTGADVALQLEGVRTYNRWLADLCAQAPGRRAGVANITVHDVDVAVADVKGAKEMGLWGGILLPPVGEPLSKLPHYNHRRYEPLWQICEELEMPVNIHGGAAPSYGEEPGALGAYLTEVTFWAHRPFWFMLWAGVFERHPRLKFMITEQTVDWIPSTLEFMDYLYAGPLFAHIRKELNLKPSEYFARQCWAGASFMTRLECELREGIGVDKIMFGTDYPHAEGTWPDTASRLRHTFGGLPEGEVRAMLGENAATAYGFDLAALTQVAERVGPQVSDIQAGPTEADFAKNGTAYLLR